MVLAQRSTDSIEAYEAYLKGRAMLYKRGAGIQQGLALMKKSLELDPTYALAWAGIADTFSLLGYYGYSHPDEARAKGGEAVAKALQYGPDLAEAHTARGLQALLFESQWATAERSFKHALQLNPGYAQASAWYHLFYRGFVCGGVGRVRWSISSRRTTSIHGPRTTPRSWRSAMRASTARIRRWRSGSSAPRSWTRTRCLTVWCRQLAMNSLRDYERGVEAGQNAIAATGRRIFPLLQLGLLLAASRRRRRSDRNS